MLKFLVPPFIKNLDKTLVLNYPFWYIVKIHYIAYFSVLMWLISYAVGCILPIDISSYNPENVTNIWIFVFSVLGVILFCVWMYYLTIYNNEDHFGKFSIWDDVKMLAVLMIGINLLMSFSYPMQLRVKTRLGNTFTDEALAKQYNDLNLAHKYINSDLENYQYCGYDLHAVVEPKDLKRDTDEFGEQRYVYDLNKYKNFVYFSPDRTNNYNYEFRNIFFGQNPNIASVQFNNALHNELKIETEYQSHKTDAQKLTAITNYFKVIALYEEKNPYIKSLGSQYHPKDYLDNYNHYEKTCTTYFPEAYNFKADDLYTGDKYLPYDDVSSNMYNIYEAKFASHFIFKDTYLTFAFYFSFFAALLVIVFRNNKWQHFLVSIVSFILLGIIIGILSLAVGIKSENVFFTLSLLMWLVTAIMSLQYYFKKDKYRIVSTVATNLFYYSLPIIPLLFCVYFHELFGWLNCYADYNDPIAVAKCEIIRQQYMDAIFYAQVIGISAFIFVVMPFYKPFFAKQKALPKEK